MPIRRDVIAEGCCYHVFNKSIAHFEIFKTPADFDYITQLAAYYKFKRDLSYSYYAAHETPEPGCPGKSIEIIAYCIMPTHFHFILKSLGEDSVCVFMNRVAAGYSHYFNLKHNRRGPLWQGRFRSVLIETDEQLLHLTRYVHLNPVTARLVENPENWEYSSYLEYVNKRSGKICEYGNILDIEPGNYRKFVEEGVEWQREMARIKALALE